MSIENKKEFDYLYHNYNKVIDNLLSKQQLNEFERKMLSNALLMDKLMYDATHGG